MPVIASLLAVTNEQTLVAHEILSNVYEFVLSLPIAFMLASSVMVGQNYKVNQPKVFELSYHSEWVMIIYLLFASGILWLTIDLWLSHYTLDVVLTQMIVTAMPIVILRSIFEGVQSLMAFNLRAVDKGWIVLIVWEIYI